MQRVLLFALQRPCKAAEFLCNAFIFNALFAICQNLRNHSLRISVPLKTIPGNKSGNSKHNRGIMAEKNRSFSVGWKLDILN